MAKRSGTRKRKKTSSGGDSPLRRIKFVTAWDSKYRIMLLLQGTIADAHAEQLGLLFKEPDQNDYDTAGYFYIAYPTNEMSVNNLKHVCAALGYAATVELKDTQGEDAFDILLPVQVAHLQKRAVEHHGGKEFQADDRVYRLARKYITMRHQHLASASILIVIEDFDPVAKARKMGIAGSVGGYAKLNPGASRKATGHDFCIHLCRSLWEEADARHKAFLIDHELRHCQRDPKGKWVMKDHDVQFHSEDLIYWPDKIQAKLDKITATQSVAKALKKEKKRAKKRKA